MAGKSRDRSNNVKRFARGDVKTRSEASLLMAQTGPLLDFATTQ